jgi:isopropylmalate/homocitrate/citramalate synthase
MRDPENPDSIQWILNHAKLLDDAGYDVIEAGFPVGEKEIQIVSEVGTNTQKAVIAAMSFMKQKSLEGAFRSIDKLIPQNRGRITMLVSTAPKLRESSVRMGKEEIIANARESLRYVFTQFINRGGNPNLQYYVEGATQTEQDFLLAVNQTMVEEAMKFCDEKHISPSDITLVASQPDTCGVAMMGAYRRMMKMLRKNIPQFADDTFQLSAHCHNDHGLAVANSLEAIEGGARQIEVTTLGIGERCGNADASSVISAIEENMKESHSHSVDISRLHDTALHLSAITGHIIQPNHPIHGINANRTEAGIHAATVTRDVSAYNAVNVRHYGNHTDAIALGAMSGKNIVSTVLRQQGVSINETMMAKLLNGLKTSETGSLSPEEFILKYMANPDMASALESEDKEKGGMTVGKEHFRYSGGDIETVQFQLASQNGAEHWSELIESASENGLVDAVLKGFEKWLRSKDKLGPDERLELSNYKMPVKQTGGSDSDVVVSLNLSRKNGDTPVDTRRGFGVSADQNLAAAKAIINAWNRMVITV